MTPSAPARAVARHLLALHRTTFIVFWAILVLAWAVVATVMGYLDDVRIDLWQWVGLAPPKYLLLTIGILAASVYLPQYVAHGITRRDFGRGSAAFFGVVAVAFGLVALAMHGVEYATFAALGRTDGLTVGYPVSSGGDAVSVLVATSVTYFGYAWAGWLIGAGFYRFGAWRGIAFIALAVVPVVVIEIAFNTGRRQWQSNEVFGIPALPDAAAAGAGLVAVAVAVVAGFLVIRAVPIRKISG